jgi:hypothetical protein
MTTQRAAIFKPLGFALTRQMEAAMGRIPEDAGSVDLPPHPPETKEVIESKLIPCERCGAVIAMLIFAPNATDPTGENDSDEILTDHRPRSWQQSVRHFPRPLEGQELAAAWARARETCRRLKIRRNLAMTSTLGCSGGNS